MWGRRNEVQDKVNELKEERDSLKARVAELEKEVREKKNDLADVEAERKRADEDIKHMVKMKLEVHEINYEKRVVALVQEKDKEVAAIKDVYRDKLEEQLKTETKNIKEMYGQILERLPNINAKVNLGK